MIMHSRATDRVRPNGRENRQINPSATVAPPVVRVAARSSRLASREARKSLLFTPVRESSGECRLTSMANTPRSIPLPGAHAVFSAQLVKLFDVLSVHQLKAGGVLFAGGMLATAAIVSTRGCSR